MNGPVMTQPCILNLVNGITLIFIKSDAIIKIISKIAT